MLCSSLGLTYVANFSTGDTITPIGPIIYDMMSVAEDLSLKLLYSCIVCIIKSWHPSHQEMQVRVLTRQRARLSKAKKQNLEEMVSEGLAEHNQQLVTLRSKDKESSEKTAIVNLLHAILALGEGSNTSLMSSKSRLCHSLFMHHCASSSVLLSLWPHLYTCLACEVYFAHAYT